MYHPFSVAETIKTAWDIFKKNFVTIIVYSIIAFLLITIVGFVIGILIPSDDFYNQMLASFLLVFIQAYTTLGLYKLIFTLIDSEYYEFEIKQVLPHITMILSYLGVVFLVSALIVAYKVMLDHIFIHSDTALQIGNILGIVIGLYLILRIMFFNSFIVDDHSGPIESLKQSFSLTKDYMSKVILILSTIIIMIAIPAKISQYFPIVSLCILFVYPYVNIVLIVTYRKLIYSHQDVDDSVAEAV